VLPIKKLKYSVLEEICFFCFFTPNSWDKMSSMKKKIVFGILFLFPITAFCSGTLTVGQFQRLNTPVDQQVDDNFVQLDVDEKRDGGRWDLVYNGSLRQYTGDRGLMFSVPEAYVSRNIGRSEFTLGRKIISWNPNDEFWAMGEINSLKNFNLLETQREGLFGFHFQRQTKYVSFMVFASGINIPQVNPTFTASGGEVKGKNEWSNPPPRFVRFRGNDVPVFYDVLYPSAQDIALHESGALKLDFHTDHHLFSLYGGYKPEPGIRIVATGYYDQLETERAIVQAKPFINHHTFYGASYNVDFAGRGEERGISAHLAYDGISPDRGTDSVFDEFESLKIQPVYERVSYATASMKWRSPFFRTSLNFIELLEGGAENTNVFAKKPRWRRAMGVDLNWSLSDSLSVKADYKYDFTSRDMGFLARADYGISRHVFVGAEVQIIDSPNDSSFWAPYRSNDSLLGRFSYLF
jgi:hypothetical protein